MSQDLHTRAKSVFLRAVELPAAARGPFVDRICRDDPSLHAEVKSLLAHHHTETFIASPGETTKLGGSEPTPPSAARSTVLSRALWAIVRLRPQGQVALGALLAILVLATIGGWVHHGTEVTLRQILGEKLRGMLDADIAAVELWIESKKAKARQWAGDRDLNDAVQALLRIDATRTDSRQRLLAAPQQAALSKALGELVESEIECLVWDRTQTVIGDTSSAAESLAQTATPFGGKLLSQVFHGEAILCVERPAEPFVRGSAVTLDGPQLAVLCPLTSDDDRIVAALMVRHIDRESELERILGYVHTGETGECYAFDREGLMLTESRFDDALMRVGLIPPSAEGRSATVVSLRDPGGDLMAGYKPKRAIAACPLTKMAAHALAGENGIDLDGYRDYRGVKVIGAWKWLSQYGFGMAIEIDRWEAFAPLKYLDVAFGAVLGLLAVTLAAVVVSWFSIARLRREVTAARQLGSYTLEELIGEGGMGQVYRARHSLLKRPTAVKVLKPGHDSPAMLARFEREVQLSSQLTHPNTIEIYDYGRTPEGVFYYAMEYIDGLNLAQVVALAGPLPSARVVHILRQICGSLREAHALDLIHRDIKPQNIMLACRGGEADVIKVLDFGLVKQVAHVGAVGASSQTVLAGTPLYMSPERLLDQHAVDARSDLYSVGAVGFKLLTGEDPFSADSPTSLFAQILELPAPRPSQHTENAIPQALDDLIVSCLAKRADDRPSGSASLLEILTGLAAAEPWSQQQAFDWWKTVGGAERSD
ncbi:MAG TPA: serine/threonine-protein kinase [Pirellulales bacterium]|nr:serine/threonine-protein kinase [Pirellulales bacterium]